MINLPQPQPKDGNVKVVDTVINDLIQRSEFGREKYGVYLETCNGRDALIDAYQEALDLVMYLRQAILEKNRG
jgi:hypothetical protein